MADASVAVPAPGAVNSSRLAVAEIAAPPPAVPAAMPAAAPVPVASRAAPTAAPQKESPGLQKESWLRRLGRAAVDESDSEELRLRKTLLMFASGLMNMAAIVWLGIYWMMGLKLPTTIPLAYQAPVRADSGDLPQDPQLRLLPLRAAVAVPVRSVRDPVEHRQLRQLQRHRPARPARPGRGDGRATARASRSPGSSRTSCSPSCPGCSTTSWPPATCPACR